MTTSDFSRKAWRWVLEEGMGVIGLLVLFVFLVLVIVVLINISPGVAKHCQELVKSLRQRIEESIREISFEGGEKR